jgi:predicted ATPase
MESEGKVEATASEPAFRGAMPAIVEEFTIRGLHGYRDISLSSKYAATILIAKNGSGKTTLLGALDAFLKGQFHRLSDLTFSTITCKLRGLDAPLELQREEIVAMYDFPGESELFSYATRFSVEPAALIDFLLVDFVADRKSSRAYQTNYVFKKIREKVGFSTAETRRICERLLEVVRGKNINIESLRKKISETIGDIEIVYLPTYRRIELPLNEDRSEEVRMQKRQTLHSRLGISRSGLFTGDIQFGLADIEERLSELNREILFDSNQGYREISANIINELLDGSFDDRQSQSETIPDKESLNLFFLRIKDPNVLQFAPHFSRVAIPDIDKIYGVGQIPSESNKFLQYFLSKLNTVIRATQDIESKVEEFIKNCNRYLSATDRTTSAPIKEDCESPTKGGSAQDDKVLKLDRKTMDVRVESLAAQRRIPLDSLSSGEKQMISLFSRLYLYDKQKIILIDEPELSLSIDWQRKILMDIVGAPSCAQIIAITHSPFVFENELEPFAKSLSVNINPTVSELPEDESEDDASDE